MDRLRKQMQKVQTQAEFAHMALQATSEASFRRLCEPMLRPGLPCCAQSVADRRDEREEIRHARLCPSRNLVTVH